jgi:hypothetical protein
MLRMIASGSFMAPIITNRRPSDRGPAPKPGARSCYTVKEALSDPPGYPNKRLPLPPTVLSRITLHIHLVVPVPLAEFN